MCAGRNTTCLATAQQAVCILLAAQSCCGHASPDIIVSFQKLNANKIAFSRMHTAHVFTVSHSMLCTRGVYLIPGGVPGPGGWTWSRGVYLVPGEVYLVPGGCTWSGRVYLVSGGGCTWSGGFVPGLGGVPGPSGGTWFGVGGVPGPGGVYLVPGGGVRYSPL